MFHRIFSLHFLTSDLMFYYLSPDQFSSVCCAFCASFRIQCGLVKTITMCIFIGFCSWLKSRPQTSAHTHTQIRKKMVKALAQKHLMWGRWCLASRITKPKISHYLLLNANGNPKHLNRSDGVVYFSSTLSFHFIHFPVVVCEI